MRRRRTWIRGHFVSYFLQQVKVTFICSKKEEKEEEARILLKAMIEKPTSKNLFLKATIISKDTSCTDLTQELK
jgi:hypothetical protein